MASVTTEWLTEPYEPVDVDDATMAFPGSVRHLMPAWDVIPDDYKHFFTKAKWSQFWSDRFYRGVSDIRLDPLGEIDPQKAWRHLNAICGSYEPKHEHKMAALWFLSEHWFADVRWKPAS